MPSLSITEAIRILELRKPLSKEQVRKAYRSQAIRFHPDKYPDETEKAFANEKFIQVKEAYELLIKIEENELNDPNYFKAQKRKDREDALRRQNTLPKWPLIDEVENVAQLILGLNFAKKLSIPDFFNFPGAALSQLFSKLMAIVKERPKNATLYVIDKLIRLFVFVVLFTAYLLLISIFIILCIAMVLLPFSIFYGLYYPYQKYCRQILMKKTGANKANEFVFMNFWKPSLSYLRARLFLWMCASAPVFLLLFASISWWSLAAAFVYTILWSFIILSVIQEWKTFKKINAYRKYS
ncbi:MAG: J domain-containing protein [Flavobacteriales bacterium]